MHRRRGGHGFVANGVSRNTKFIRIEINFSNFCSDSPVLWIRLDPEMIILRSVVIEQPDFQWQFQLRHERDVTAQLEAIAALQKYPTPATRMALTDTIENNNCFYKVRCRAAHCLKEVRLVISIVLQRVQY